MAKGKFVWGEIVTIHQVGGIEVTEYHPWKRESSTIRTGVPDMDMVEFYGVVDGKDTNQIWDSLDAALAGCIAFRHTGGTVAAHFFMKMLVD